MIRRLSFLVVVLCTGVLLAGCSEPEEVVPTGPNTPPPPTAQEIAQKIILEAQLDMPVPPKGASFPLAVRNSMLEVLRVAKAQNAGDLVGKEALEHVVGRIDKRIREFTHAEAWQHVMVFIEAHEIFMQDSKKYGSLKDEAFIQLRKPKVTVTGLPVIEGRQLILLTLYVPITDKTYKERVLVGDELHGLKVVNIFGNDRGVTLEYLETGERFVAYLPGAK